MSEQPSIVRAILLSFLGLILFYLTNFAVASILGVAIYLLAQVPVLSMVAKWASKFLAPDSFLIPICGYFTTIFAIGKLSQRKDTANLTCVLLGAYLLFTSVVCLVFNIKCGNAIWINIVYGIAGVIFIARKSKDVE